MTKLVFWLSILGLAAAVGCALAGLAAPLGYRFGYWHYRAGIGALANVFWFALGTAVFCALVASVAAIAAATRGVAAGAALIGVAGLVIAGVTAWIPYDLRMTANRLPAIHDITTDLADPPKFARVATLRKPDENPAAYDGQKVGELQRAAYPDLAPLALKAPRDKVYIAAHAAIVSMGLEVVEADMAQGRIEATHTSLLFGFKDDVVVRIASDAQGTRVDTRSKSRVGRNDFGMNAGRIRDFQARLKAMVA